MTWPDGIAAAVLTAFALLITLHQHRSTPRTTTPRRTETDRDHQEPPAQAPHRRHQHPHGSRNA